MPTTSAGAPRAAPWPQRPVVELGFDVDVEAGRATGREHVVFTPDRRVCEMVFRLEANKPELARAGTELQVSAARVQSRPVRFTLARAGGLDRRRGTALTLPLTSCAPAGTALTVDLDFTLVLGAGVDERTGYSPDNRTAYLATAFPLLAWERGRGWLRDPDVDLTGEMAGSEDFRLADLTVVAAEGLAVTGTGARAGTSPGPRPRSVAHRFRAEAVRDVAVAVGDYDVLDRDVDGVALHVATPRSPVGSDPQVWAGLAEQAIRKLSGLYGPYPYTDLWVTVVPQIGTGIEFPSAMFVGEVNLSEFGPTLVVHETAHMWFYGLVGNDQGRDPWLDESFATFAEALVTGSAAEYEGADVPPEARGQLGRPMAFWARHEDAYGVGVYAQGAAALLAARRGAGPDRFDAAVRAYVDRNAHRIATPADFRRALAGLPEAVQELDRAGAFVQAPR